MKRWTRNVKDFEYVAESSSNLFGTQVGSSVLYVNALEAVQAVENDPDAAEIFMKYLANAKKEIQRMVDERHTGSENMVTSGYSSDSGSEGFETDFDDVNANTYGASGSSAYMSDADIRAIHAPTVRNPVGRPRQNRYPRMFERFKKVNGKNGLMMVSLTTFLIFCTLSNASTNALYFLPQMAIVTVVVRRDILARHAS
jgi:hypothetical protein